MCVDFARFINGSSLLHTAAYFGHLNALRSVVKLGVDLDLLDYKGATALHRARDTETIKVCRIWFSLDSVCGSSIDKRNRTIIFCVCLFLLLLHSYMPHWFGAWGQWA